MLDCRPDLKYIPSYDVTERAWELKLNANESNLNLPPLVEDRVLNRLGMAAFNRYPTDELADLEELIAGTCGLRRENVLLGNGSSEILEKLFYVFGGDSRNIVYPVPSFSMYKIYAKLSGASGVEVPLNDDYTLDMAAFIEQVKSNDAKLAVLCTPNNPTGNAIAPEDIELLLKSVRCPVVIDEAYVEFGGASSVKLLTKYDNLMVARTFSKAYGLAGARVGYLLGGAEIMAEVGKVFLPYHINTLSLITAATVYQMRDEFVPRIQMYIAERKSLAARLAQLPELTVYPSEANFLLIRYAKAGELNERLIELGIGVRSFGGAARLENCLRVTVGTRADNERLYDVVADFVIKERK